MISHKEFTKFESLASSWLKGMLYALSVIVFTEPVLSIQSRDFSVFIDLFHHCKRDPSVQGKNIHHQITGVCLDYQSDLCAVDRKSDSDGSEPHSRHLVEFKECTCKQGVNDASTNGSLL